MTTFTCDSPGCKSFCDLHASSPKPGQSMQDALKDRGWSVQPSCEDSSKCKHFCPLHAPTDEHKPAAAKPKE